MSQVFAGSAHFPLASAGVVLTIGNFDGVHLGHQALLATVVAAARAAGVPAAVYTFEPPPRAILAPERAQPRILSLTDKVRLLGEAGVDAIIVESFSRAFAQHPPEWFVDEVLGRRIQPLALRVGYDFRFGRARAGDLHLVAARLPALQVEALRAITHEGAIVSSSAIRAHLAAGDLQAAAALLGRPHFLRGTVVGGDQRGRTLGFPTANVESETELLPPRGVYAVSVQIDGARPHLPAVANLGTRPTFDGSRFLIEVHLLDWSGDLYGRELVVHFAHRLRGEQRFSGPAALIDQLRRDVAEARLRLPA